MFGVNRQTDRHHNLPVVLWHLTLWLSTFGLGEDCCLLNSETVKGCVNNCLSCEKNSSNLCCAALNVI